MIVAVNADTRARFLQAAGASPATYAQMAMRLAVFGDLPGSGWQFYTSDMEVLAIALRGSSVTVAGEYDPEELGSFCSFLGVDKITTPNALLPAGYTCAQCLTVYTLARGQALRVPPFTGAFAGQEGAFVLDKAPSVMKVIPLLFGADASAESVLADRKREDIAAEAVALEDGTATRSTADARIAADIAMQEQYYSDNTTARNFGMAEFWLLSHGDVPIFTLAASAVVEQTAYLSAGETIEAYRGQGIGGHYIATMANEYAARGYDVCFVCEAPRCRFYERLGFQKSDVLYQYVPCAGE